MPYVPGVDQFLEDMKRAAFGPLNVPARVRESTAGTHLVQGPLGWELSGSPGLGRFMREVAQGGPEVMPKDHPQAVRAREAQDPTNCLVGFLVALERNR